MKLKIKLQRQKKVKKNKKKLNLLNIAGGKAETIDISKCLRGLKKILGMYLCATHHGSVAVESAFLGHKVIASTASPYDSMTDSFIDFYFTKEEYRDLIISWSQDFEDIKHQELTSVLNFILRNNFRYNIT